MKPVQILIDEELLAGLDEDEEVRRRGRSKVLRGLIAAYLESRREARLDVQYRHTSWVPSWVPLITTSQRGLGGVLLGATLRNHSENRAGLDCAMMYAAPKLATTRAGLASAVDRWEVPRAANRGCDR